MKLNKDDDNHFSFEEWIKLNTEKHPLLVGFVDNNFVILCPCCDRSGIGDSLEEACEEWGGIEGDDDNITLN